MNNDVISRANKIKRKKKRIRIIKVLLVFLMLLLLVLYTVVGVVYGSGTFTIRFDRDLYYEKSIIVYDDENYKVYRSELYAENVDSLDNISYKWLPDDLDDYDGGSHNGDNYIAYTFYVENTGEEKTDYWSEINIEHFMKNVDEAVRIRVYKNGEYNTYAKISGSGESEPATVPFQTDDYVELDHVEEFNPGDINKYTIVIWIEGTDPDCTDNILGGEIQISMSFNSEDVVK